MSSSERIDRYGGWALLALTALAMGAFVLNGWVQDDGPKILYDRRVQEWPGLWRGFIESYWAPPSKSGLYRPLAMASFVLQWKLGGGSVLLFRIADLLAYAATVWVVWRVARRWLPAAPAWLGAALFAVHPLHTEVVAVAVNQGESIVALCAVLAVMLWLDFIDGKRPAPVVVPAIALLYVVALGFKEHALVIPALLVAAELFAPAQSLGERLRVRGAPLALIGALGIGWWVVRAQVLGDVAGAAAAEGLRGEGIGARVVTMLSVVPSWVRLLVWPARLSSDYAPREIDPDLAFGAPHLIGLLLLWAWVVALAWGWKRDRVVAFGLLWIAIGIFPVSNVFLPTGILLAERTLFLPSVGLVLIAGALFARVTPWWQEAARPARLVAGGALALVMAAGIARDLRRAPDWRGFEEFIAAQLRDAPLSWRAHAGYGIWAFEHHDRRGGEAHLREAIALWPHHARPYHTLADYYRGDALCEPAIPLYREGLAREADRPRQRLSAAACLIWVGEYQEAAAVARAAPAGSAEQDRLDAAAKTADSAQAVHAAPKTVRLAPSRDHAAEVGWRAP